MPIHVQVCCSKVEPNSTLSLDEPYFFLSFFIYVCLVLVELCISAAAASVQHCCSNLLRRPHRANVSLNMASGQTGAETREVLVGLKLS